MHREGTSLPCAVPKMHSKSTSLSCARPKTAQQRGQHKALTLCLLTVIGNDRWKKTFGLRKIQNAWQTHNFVVHDEKRIVDIATRHKKKRPTNNDFAFCFFFSVHPI
jgi:hypothetical protein